VLAPSFDREHIALQYASNGWSLLFNNG